MLHFSLALEAIPTLRNAAAASCDLETAASLAELAGVGSIRFGVREELRPVTEIDVRSLRRRSRRFELRMPASQGTLKVAMEARPDLVVLSGSGWDSPCAASPIDLRRRDAGLAAVIRALDEANIPVTALIKPDLESVKAAHAFSMKGIEIYTGATVDLPEAERQAGLEALGDAARLASKLSMKVAVGGGLGYATTRGVLAATPGCERVAAGRAIIARALLVGLDRAIRDFRALLA